MKRVLAVLVVVFLLSGCSAGNAELDRAMNLREKLLKSEGIQFNAKITADYADEIYTFSMECRIDSKGDLSFKVTAPETISGISGTVSDTGGQLTFDNTALAFKLLADGQITPVSAPWLMFDAMRSGYISASGKDADRICICIDDSYQDEMLHTDIWVNSDGVPVSGEILWKGRRIMSVQVDNFTFV